MSKRIWWKFSFEINSNLEDIIIWKLNSIEIQTYAFNILKSTKNNKLVTIWLPHANWPKLARKSLEEVMRKLLNDNQNLNFIFSWDAIEEEDWMESWKKFWKPEPIGKDLVVLPCWMKLPEKYSKKKVIRIDPGAAFGTGGHPSTSLCLETMEEVPINGKSIIDVGSGSGILSIAANLLGAKTIVAVDSDYLAVNSTLENYQLNFGNLSNFKSYKGSFADIQEKYALTKFDLIMCNILANVIKVIVPNISKSLKRGGKAIFSGILASQREEIIKVLNLNYLKIDNVSFKNDWICILATKIQPS